MGASAALKMGTAEASSSTWGAIFRILVTNTSPIRQSLSCSASCTVLLALDLRERWWVWRVWTSLETRTMALSLQALGSMPSWMPCTLVSVLPKGRFPMRG